MICIYIYTLCIFREEPTSLCAFPQIFSLQHGFGVQRCYGFRISLPTVKQATFERPPCALGEWKWESGAIKTREPSWKLGFFPLSHHFPGACDGGPLSFPLGFDWCTWLFSLTSCRDVGWRCLHFQGACWKGGWVPRVIFGEGRLGNQLVGLWSPSWNAMMCDSHRPIRYCVCKGDIANRLSKSYKSPFRLCTG